MDAVTLGAPTIDDVAAAVFAALDQSLDDGLDEAAISHMAEVVERDTVRSPHEQILIVDGVSYRVMVEVIA